MVSIAGSSKSRLAALQRTKLYDVAIALPFLALLSYGLPGRLPRIRAGLGALMTGHATSVQIVTWIWELSSLAFSLLLIYLFVARKIPERKSDGILPRVIAVVGTFSIAAFRLLNHAHLSVPMTLMGALLSVIGTTGAVIAAMKLGRSFSVFPEARALVTTGPYSVVRHPLYLAEMIGICGLVVQFEQPWALAMGAAAVGLLYWRTIFEERVLAAAYPQYRAYAQRTSRLIPYLF